MRKLLPLGTLGVFALILLPVFLLDSPWPLEPRDYLEARGVEETGAVNLVSSLYLGYRALDTLGETLVLLVALGGTISILKKEGFGLPDLGSTPSARLRRTGLLRSVTGKLGPVVLLFGLYLMAFGHLSPGGGFQGGVVVASGIIFLALGSPAGPEALPLTRPKVLGLLENLSSLILVCTPLFGFFSQQVFFADPLRGAGSSHPWFIILLNSLIGLKVGAGIGYMGILMLSGGRR